MGTHRLRAPGDGGHAAAGPQLKWVQPPTPGHPGKVVVKQPDAHSDELPGDMGLLSLHHGGPQHDRSELIIGLSLG